MNTHRDFSNYHENARQGHFGPPINRSLSANSPVIVLDEYNSDLHFVIDADGCTGSTLHKDGFEYMWAGARSTYGVSQGKVCYEVRIIANLPVNMPETERTPHVARVGWSTDSSNLNVGEDRYSYGYGGTGKSSSNNKFLDYGEPYKVGDIITCYMDFDNYCIFFCKNGLYLGKAFDLSPETRGMAFFPHITIKNMKVQVNFGSFSPLIPPVQGFTMIDCVPKDVIVRGTRSPDTFRDCQVIMMVGLPGAGKTVWAKKYLEDNKHLKINILGTNNFMDRMKVTGLTRNRNYHGRWDQLIKRATDVLNKALKIAEKKKRNYILDQTNVYPGARGRKMTNFHDFKRIAAVVVNTNEVLKERTEKREREEGKIVPEKAVMEMKANFTLPEIGESFDDVWFIEENRESSIRLVEEFRQEGKLFVEREREKELKRKRDELSAGGEPFPKEPYNPQHEHNRPIGDRHESPNQHYSPRDQPGTHHPSGAYNEPPHQHYPPRDQPRAHHPSGAYNEPPRQHYPSMDQPRAHHPSGAYNEPPRQHYHPRDQSAGGQSSHGYPPQCYGNEQPRYPSQETYGNFNAHYPPWGDVGHDLRSVYGQHNYQPRRPAQPPYGAYQHQPPAYAQNYYSHPGGYQDNFIPYPMPDSRPGGCSLYDPIENRSGRLPQEHAEDARCNDRHNPYHSRGGFRS